MQTGIAIAGNIIVDYPKEIDEYPQAQQLITIESISKAAGGLVPNVAQDLARLDPALPITLYGVVSDDADGLLVEEALARHKNIDLSKLIHRGATSFTDVMADQKHKTRTFFQFRGGNATFGPADIDFDSMHTKILHIGYALLLDKMDSKDSEYGTVLARVLHEAQVRGILTSIDAVTEVGGRIHEYLPDSLRYTDYSTINESEAAALTGIQVRNEDGSVLYQNIPVILKAMLEMGIAKWACIHAREFGAGMDHAGNYVLLPSLFLPKDQIKGTVGAGDAFCSGILYGVYRGLSLQKSIQLAITAATMSLLEANASDGVRPFSKIETYYENHEKETL